MPAGGTYITKTARSAQVIPRAATIGFGMRAVIVEPIRAAGTPISWLGARIQARDRAELEWDILKANPATEVNPDPVE
jgi:hypothetical protein